MLAMIQVEIHVKWWFRYLYLPCVVLLSVSTGLDINREKFNYWLKKGTIVKVNTTPIRRSK